MRGGVELPKLLSVLATGDPDGEVRGLDTVTPDLWPPIAVVHIAFDVMVACGTAMLALVLWGAWAWWRSRAPPWGDRRFLLASLLLSPAGLIATEAGWTVTEVGRQPWIVRGFMRTAEAVTPVPNLQIHLAAFTSLYLVLGVVVVVALRNHVRASVTEGMRR